jgi:hypothetical protein
MHPVRVGGVDRRKGTDDDRLLELASDFPLPSGVGAMRNRSHAEGPLVSIIGVMGSTYQLPDPRRAFGRLATPSWMPPRTMYC